MRRPLVDPQKCKKCKVCLIEKNCTENKVVIREDASSPPWIDMYICRGCMRCMKLCPHEAVINLVQPCTLARKMSW